jgi:hypothetical protein
MNAVETLLHEVAQRVEAQTGEVVRRAFCGDYGEWVERGIWRSSNAMKKNKSGDNKPDSEG